MSYDLIGHSPSTTPVWVRAVVTREGPDVVTRCCVVAEGQVLPIEVRVNVPALAATLRSMGLVPSGGDSVSGFGSFLKKAVKSVTKSKVAKAVGKAVKKVVNSPVAMIANPAAVITAHTTAKAATGKGLLKGTAGKVVDLGTAVTLAAAGKAAKPASALNFVSKKASAALGIGLKAVQTAKTGAAIASAAKTAQNVVNTAKTAAQNVQTLKDHAAKTARHAKAMELKLNALKRSKNPAFIKKAQDDLARAKAAASAAQKRLSTSKDYAMPLARKAIATTTNVKKLAPALAKQIVVSDKVKKSIANIAAKAKAGVPEAKQAAAVIAKSAQALDKILMLQAQAAGGLPGLLVTADGRIVRAPRGRFRLRTTTVQRPDVLYRGAKEAQLKGLFSAVSGSPAWGGSDDPGNDIEGPLSPVRYPSGSFELDDWSAVSGVTARRRARPYRPEITRLKRQLQDCGDAYDELAAEYMQATGIDRSDYAPGRVIDTHGSTVGMLTP